MSEIAVTMPGEVEPFSWGWFLFSIRGRTPRSHYWLRFILPSWVVSIILMVADVALGIFDPMTGLGLLSGLFTSVALWPNIAVAVKRLHDRNKSGWWLLLLLIPLIGIIWFFVEGGCLRGTRGPNRFGPDPLEARF